MTVLDTVLNARDNAERIATLTLLIARLREIAEIVDPVEQARALAPLCNNDAGVSAVLGRVRRNAIGEIYRREKTQERTAVRLGVKQEFVARALGRSQRIEDAMATVPEWLAGR